MPAPKLRHYRHSPATANTWETVTGVVTTGRALVVSRLVVVSTSGLGGASVVFAIRVFSPNGAIANNVTLAPGDIYETSGVVVPAGESLDVNCATAGGVIVSVFGQEVDD